MGCSSCSNNTEKPNERTNPNKTDNIAPKLIKNNIPISQQNLVRKSSKGIKEIYKFTEIIKKGGHGTTYKVLHKILNQYRVAKVIPKDTIIDNIDEKIFIQEIEILSRLDHPNIIKLFDHLEEDNNFYMITELTTGGDLSDHILKFKNFNE